MTEHTITAKNQITLRKDLLRHLGVAPGHKVTVDFLPNGRAMIRASKKTGKISDIFGMLYREDGPKLTIEDIKEATEKGWAGEL